MPCRALEAFRRSHCTSLPVAGYRVLMPCRALEAFRHKGMAFAAGTAVMHRLNALSGIGGVQTQVLKRAVFQFVEES